MDGTNEQASLASRLALTATSGRQILSRAKSEYKRKYLRHNSKLETFLPRAHGLPAYTMWAITFCTAAIMACINLVEVLCIESGVLWKFSWMQEMMLQRGVWGGVVTLAVISAAFSVIGVILMEFSGANLGSGSGNAENKCFLNGTSSVWSNLRGFFSVKTLFLRISTSILANLAGFPVGREGPTVVIGSNVAYCVSFIFTWHSTHYAVAIGEDEKLKVKSQEKIEHASRIACAVGGACGMSMIFNTPIGGMLYMFEDMTSANWPSELTFQAFVGTTFCTLLSYGFLAIYQKSINDFVIFAWEPVYHSWGWIDMPWFVVVAGLVGVLTSLHTRGLLWVSAARKRWFPSSRVARCSHTVLYAVICALISGLASLLGECRAYTTDAVGVYLQFNCEEGYYNTVATLLVNTSHSAVKIMFACNYADSFGANDTFLAFIVYSFLNMGLSGLPVPGGAFTGTMLMGSFVGRGLGHILRLYVPGDYAHPGIFSVVGSAAMLCGFKQMTATVVVICIQCVNNVTVLPVVMLSVTVALVVNRSINPRGFDEQQIREKKMPFLESEPPHDIAHLTARDLCDPDVQGLHEYEEISYVNEVLKSEGDDFPVFDNSDMPRCIGLVTRKRLWRASQEWQGRSEDKLRIFALMDRTPFFISSDMQLERFYGLIAKQGEHALCVVNRPDAEFVGIISRTSLVKSIFEAETGSKK